MKLVRSLSLALALFAAATPNWAAQHDQHKAHHPAGSASAAASRSMPGKTTPEMARMANHMKSMQEVHDRMMAAKTPEERNALMGEHMKTMQEGLSMMKGMGGMAGPESPPTDGRLVVGAGGAAWLYFRPRASQALGGGPFRHYPFDPVAAGNFQRKLGGLI